MVRPYEQRNNRPKDVDQGMQAMSVETIRQMVIKAVLQVIENSFNPRMTAIEKVIEGLTLSMNNIER